MIIVIIISYYLCIVTFYITLPSTDKEKLNKYCDSHDGFYQYMKILENTASAIASGSIKVPK